MARPANKKHECTRCGAKVDSKFCIDGAGTYYNSRCDMCRRNIPVTLQAIRVMYAREYPEDRAAATRSWRFCAGKLHKSGLYFSARSKKKWNG